MTSTGQRMASFVRPELSAERGVLTHCLNSTPSFATTDSLSGLLRPSTEQTHTVSQPKPTLSVVLRLRLDSPPTARSHRCHALICFLVDTQENHDRAMREHDEPHARKRPVLRERDITHGSTASASLALHQQEPTAPS